MSFNDFKKRKVVDLTTDTSKIPSKQEVCLMLLGGEDAIQKSMSQLDPTKIVFSGKDLKSGEIIRWHGNTGWSNPFSRLRFLYGGDQQLYDSYWAGKAAQDKDSKVGEMDIVSAINWAAGFTPEVQAAYAWLEMVVDQNWPLCSVEKPQYRKNFIHKHIISIKRLSFLILVVGELVEKKIKELMMDRMGCLIHDGFTRGGVHFVGVYASFIAKEGTPDAQLEIPLLACCPMPCLPSEDEEEVEEADALCAAFDQEHDPEYTTSFNAETHTNFFESTLEMYDHTIASWVIAFIGDNTSTNLKTARDNEKPTIPCANHVIALDNKDYRESGAEMFSHIDKIREVLSSVKRSCCESGMLGKLTNLKPTCVRSCKWQADFSALSRFDRLWIPLSALTEDSSSRISFDTSLSFKNNTKKYRGQMRALTQLHVHLQTHGLSKHKGQLLIDNFFQSVSTFKDVHGHALEGYGIKNEHSKMGNKHETDPPFITGIDKIANKDEGSMTEAEKDSCKSLLKSSLQWYRKMTGDEDDNEDDEEEVLTTRAERSNDDEFDMMKHLHKKVDDREEHLRQKASQYADTDCILASAAIVECLWSKFDALVPQRRSGMSPVMIEGILFLKENRHYWGIATVSEALVIVKSRLVTNRLKKKIAQLEEEEELITGEAAGIGLQGGDVTSFGVQSLE